MTSFNDNDLFKGAISKYSHILRCWGVRTSVYEFEKVIILTCKYLGMTIPEDIWKYCCQVNELRYKSRIPRFSSGTQVLLVVKNPPANAGDIRDVGSIPGSGRFTVGEYGNPLQYSCLENPMDRGAWRATVHGVAESRTRLK